MGHTSTSFPTSLPVLDGKNWNRWNIQMKAIMGFQEIAEIVELGYSQLNADPSEQERVTYKENKMKDCKAMCLLHQCVDEAHFEKIASAQTSQEAWLILEKCNKGAEQLKKGSLEAHEQRFIESSTDKVNQALQAQTFKKGRYLGRNYERNRGKGRDFRGKNLGNSGNQDQERTDLDQASCYSKRGGGSNLRGGRKKFDRRRVKCFNCSKMGHFSSECQSHNKQQHDEAHMVKEDNEFADDDSPILLMMTTSQGNKSEEI
ncbi:PREDICTED: uncharacterized protein LOC109350515 [Lupinus angustifolius]|uniref:uncharacterized protein LOC109350515 n=1 Tax=Lupinus angustifolius TaxID=3871 RepID=UPI00092F17D7|nr:PREDICTED: uncharacterized protein LOC109350515 [Lupinus angustifolius]